jgi:hypothetical protein
MDNDSWKAGADGHADVGNILLKFQAFQNAATQSRDTCSAEAVKLHAFIDSTLGDPSTWEAPNGMTLEEATERMQGDIMRLPGSCSREVLLATFTPSELELYKFGVAHHLSANSLKELIALITK